MREKLGKIFRVIADAYFCEEPALRELVRKDDGSIDQFVSVGGFTTKVDKNSVLNWQVADNNARVGKYLILARHGFQNIRFDLKVTGFPKKESGNNQRDDENNCPVYLVFAKQQYSSPQMMQQQGIIFLRQNVIFPKCWQAKNPEKYVLTCPPLAGAGGGNMSVICTQVTNGYFCPPPSLRETSACGGYP